MNKSQKEFFTSIAVVIAATFGICCVRLSNMPKVLASGNFHQVAHKGVGQAEILQKANGKFVLRLNNFRTTEKPNLEVYLISAPDALENETVKRSEIFSLGKLQTADGEQEYSLPDGFNIYQYNAVTVWNTKYAVNYTTAPLKRH
jgi:hypothetical protein